MRSVGTHPQSGRSWFLLDGEDGATMVEYSLMLVFIAVAALVAVQAFGISVLGLFQSAVDGL
jgi:Flp pilus assembly pilin Flp